jgi:hypothetical protein
MLHKQHLLLPDWDIGRYYTRFSPSLLLYDVSGQVLSSTATIIIYLSLIEFILSPVLTKV